MTRSDHTCKSLQSAGSQLLLTTTGSELQNCLPSCWVSFNVQSQWPWPRLDIVIIFISKCICCMFWDFPYDMFFHFHVLLAYLLFWRIIVWLIGDLSLSWNHKHIKGWLYTYKKWDVKENLDVNRSLVKSGEGEWAKSPHEVKCSQTSGEKSLPALSKS